MSAKDVFHNPVKNALQKEGWRITDNPFFIRFDGVDRYIDLGAEKVIAAEKDGQRLRSHILEKRILYQAVNLTILE